MIAQLAEACEAASVVAVVGESGSGKSAAVAQFVGDASRFNRLVWLTSEQLSRGSQAEAMVALGLRHSIPNLIGLSAVKNCALVLDGFEHFQGAAHSRAIELIETLRGEAFAGWKVIVTCQTHGWEQVHDSLVSTGVTHVQRVDFGGPSLEQVLSAVGEQPHLRLLLLRHDLQPILQNLVLLDWVVRANVGRTPLLAPLGRRDRCHRLRLGTMDGGWTAALRTRSSVADTRRTRGRATQRSCSP